MLFRSFVRLGQGGSCYAAVNTHVMELRLLGTQTGFYIPKAFPVCELGKRHGVILIAASECLDFVIALVAMDAATERMHWQVIHELRKDEFACVHAGKPPVAGMRQRHCAKHDQISKP